MGRNYSNYPEKGNRMSRNAAKRKCVLLGVGVIIAIVLYKYLFPSSGSELVYHQPVDLPVRAGNQFPQELQRNTKIDQNLPSVPDRADSTSIEIDIDDDDGEIVDDTDDKDEEEDDMDAEAMTSNVKDKPNNKTGDYKSTLNVTSRLQKTKPQAGLHGLNSSKETGNLTEVRRPKVSSNVTMETVGKDKNVTAVARDTDNRTVSDVNTSVLISNLSSSHAKQNMSLQDDPVTKSEEDCIKFRVKYLNKTNTAMCRRNISSVDLWSQIIKDEATWKMKHMSEMKNITVSNRDIVAIDIGCGTGAFILYISMHARKAVAVDPHLENIRVLQRASFTSKTSNIKPLWNIVSNTSTQRNDSQHIPPWITLDDIGKSFVNANESVILLLSQNGLELEALDGGKSFFTNTKVCLVIVNFSHQRTRNSGSAIVKLMQGYGLYPFKDTAMKENLINVPPSEYESSVVFRGNNTNCETKPSTT